MTITLQDFASGDTNYVSKLNSNSDVIEAAIGGLQSLTSGAAFAGATLNTAYAALFGTTVAVIGDDSYVCSDAGGSPSGYLAVTSGYCYRPTLVAVLSKATASALGFAGQSAATYYVVIDSTGEPTFGLASTDAIYSVVWTGSTFGAITRLATIVWGAVDWIAAQSSTGLSGSYTSLDDRLEAIEAAIGAAVTAQGPNKVYAGPSGGSPTNALPTFRLLVSSDMPAGIGTVTSVAATVPAEFSISGSPITSSGTLAVTKATQSANQVWAGPTSGSAAQPAFRALVAADVPTFIGDTGGSPNSSVQGAVPVANQGDAAAAKYLKADGSWGIPAGTGGAGTVTSVNITQPAAGITASGGPITSSGSITLALANDLSALEGLSSTGFAKRTGTDAWSVSTNIAPSDFASVDSFQFLAGPTAGSPTTGAPTFRSITYADLPTGIVGKPRIDAHTYGASVTLDCSLYDVFEITLTGNITITFSGGTDGQRIAVRLTQDGTGSRLVTWDSGVGFGTDIATATATTTASKVDYFGLVYSSAASKYHMVAVARGY